MPADALTPDEIATAEELHKAQKELAWQLTRMGVDTATIFDPTGLTNIPAMGMALYDGDFLSAGLSLIGLIPVLGKASDAIKEARMAERAAELGKVVAALTAKLSKLGKLRKEAKVAEEVAKIGKEAKEAKALAEAKEAENALEAAKQALEKAKQTPGACVPCAEKKVAEAEKAVEAEKVAVSEGKPVTIDGHPVPPGVEAGHYENLGRDPDIGQKFRPSEADTALRLEKQEAVTLERYKPSPGKKGDWVDPRTGKVYDGCSPPHSPSGPNQHFDGQIANGNYEKSLRRHLDDPTVDRVVIDTTERNLSPSQMSWVDRLIQGLSPEQQAKIVRIPKP